MKLLLLLTFLASILNAESIMNGKDFYEQRPYFYWENHRAMEKYDRVYDINKVTLNRHIKTKMGFCITEYELYGIVHLGCNDTFSTLLFYQTKPEGLMRKDIIEFYHDMSLSDYEKNANIKRNDKRAIRSHKNHYNNNSIKQMSDNITNNVLNHMRETNRLLKTIK